MGAQGGFHRRLGEHHRGHVAERVWRLHHVHPADQLALHAEMLGGGEWRDMGQHLFRHAHVLQHAQDFVVDGDRARLVPNGGAAVDRQGAQPRLPQQPRCHGAGRAEAYNGDVKIGHAGTSPMAVCARFTSSLLGGAMPQWSVRPGGQVQSPGPPTR